MLRYSRKYRLASKHDIQSVFAKPHKITRQYLTILYRPNELTHPRLAIIINKHFVRRAVDRNRVRRVIRERFRHHQEALKGLDIVVLFRSKCTALGNKVGKDTLRDNIDTLWQALINSHKPV